MAHALLEYYSVSLPKKVSARRQPYLDAHLNYAVLPLEFVPEQGVFFLCRHAAADMALVLVLLQHLADVFV